MKWEHSGPTEIQVRDNDKNQMFFSTTEYTQNIHGFIQYHVYALSVSDHDFLRCYIYTMMKYCSVIAPKSRGPPDKIDE